MELEVQLFPGFSVQYISSEFCLIFISIFSLAIFKFQIDLKIKCFWGAQLISAALYCILQIKYWLLLAVIVLVPQ